MSRMLGFLVAVGWVYCAHCQTLVLPLSALEGSGILTNAGKLQLSANATSNITFQLQSQSPDFLAVPATVAINVGQSNATFDLGIGDDYLVEGDRSIMVTATTDAFTLTNWLTILENDPDHIRFSSVPSLTFTNASFVVSMRAEKADGTLQTNFNRSINIIADSADGPLPVEPTVTAAFVQGQQTATFRVVAPGRAVRLRASEYPGESDPFSVVAPPFLMSTQMVADIAWLPNLQTLLASVPSNGGIYSNTIVAIDPATGFVTNSYPVGFNPGRMEISPDAGYLYVALSNRTVLRRFDLASRSAGISFALGTNANPFRFAYDFCVPPGLSDSVVVQARDQDSLGNTSLAGAFRYDHGVPTALPDFGANGWLVESLAADFGVAVSPPLARGNASTGAILATNGNFSGMAVTYRDGQLFDDRGNCYRSDTLAAVGSYPNVLEQVYWVGLPEVDVPLRRAYYLAGYFNYGTSFYQLKVFDRDLRQPLFQWAVPNSAGAPNRFLRCGSNLLAYVTDNNQLWFIRGDATQPQAPAADLALSVSAPSVAVAGSNYTFTLSLSNAGPGLASVVRITNALPPMVDIVQATPSSGSISAAGGAFTWNAGNLAPGSNIMLQVTLRFHIGGWQTNNVWALGFEADPIFTNNLITLPIFVQLPAGASGVFAVNYSSEDLLYDPVRDRLLISADSTGDIGQTNGLAIFDPYRGVTESFLPFGSRPGKLARSGGGEYLYLSLPDAALVRRYDLPSLSQNLEFGLGGEYIYGEWYPFYAGDLVVVPGSPQSVVAWRIRRAGPMASEYGQGIALVQNGTMSPNTTAAGGSWRVEFDTDSGTLFGYNSGDLRRCSVDSSGVSFAEQYPSFSSGGSDIECAAGRLFTTTGREIQVQPFKIAWLYGGAENAALVEPDAASGRVFYLLQNGGWQLNAYDISNKSLLGSISISNVVGTPSSLVRWGTNGLAFRTSSNQLFVIRSPLVQPSANADLALGFSGPTDPVGMGSNLVFTISVTNLGPSAAAAVVLTNAISGGVTLTAISGNSGTWTTNGQGMVWNLNGLAVGAHAELTCTVIVMQTGVATAMSTVSAATPDPFAGNNTWVHPFVLGAPISLDSIVTLPLSVSDLAWSPALGRLLLATTTNLGTWGGGLASLDPASLQIQFSSVLGVNAGRLTKSRDDAVVYAGVDSGVDILPISSLSVTNRFVITASDPRSVATDLKVVPGSNQVVVVASRSRTDNSTWLTAYDSAIQRTNGDFFYSTGASLEFGNDPAVVYCKDYSGNGFRSYTLGSLGLTLSNSDTGVLPTYTTMDICWGNGRIYTTTGNVINPVTRSVIGTIPGIPSGARVLYDSGSDRVLFLSPGTNSATLSAYDAPSLLYIGSKTIPGASGTLGGFVRWGMDGFAFSTSSGQLFVFRSNLIPKPPADVSVALSLGTAPYLAGSNLFATITISNAGPNPATDVIWSNTLPSGTVISSAMASTGTVTIAGSSAWGAIPTLDVGSTATANVTFSASAGIAIDQVGTSASSGDPNFTNNSSVALLWIQPSTGSTSFVSLILPVKEMERDPARPLLYASFGSGAGALANTVAAIDPVNGGVSVPMRVGSDPGLMAASPDGQYLYVALDGAGMVQKLALPGLQIVSSFAVPNSRTVSRMVVSPVNSDMVAIRRSLDGKTSLHVGGVKMPGELSDQDLFAFSDVTGQLFGCAGSYSNVKLYRLNTGSSGLTLLEGQPGKQSQATDLQASGGILFFNRGMVVDPVAGQVRAIMPVANNSIVEPDAASGRVYYLTPAGAAWVLRAFDIGQAIEVGNLSLPALSSSPRQLLRWGPDGLALYNTNAQVLILRGQLVPTNAPIDLALSQSANATTATTNDTLTFSMGLTNAGPALASGVVVTQSFSLVVSNVGVSASSGTINFSNGLVTWKVGNLQTAALASATVTLRAAQAGTLNVSAGAYHDLNDQFWGNNAAFNSVNVVSSTTSNILQLKLAVRDLVYDTVHDLIYASTPATNRLLGNVIVAIDPATGTMQRVLAAGSEPNQLAISSDATVLYAALDGATGIQRYNLQTGRPDISYPLATNDMCFAQDMKVQPGSSGSVAVSLGSYNYASGYPSDVVLYNNGNACTNRGGPARGIAFSTDGAYAFGYVSPGSGNGLLRMRAVSTGFQTDTASVFTTTPGDLKFANGRLYSYAGQVVDPFAPVLIGSFGVSAPQAIDADKGRAFCVVQKGTAWELRSFDLATLLPVATQAVANVQGTASTLIRCGSDRLAFRTSSNQVFIVRSALVPATTLAPADLQLTQTAVQDFSAAVETLKFTMYVTNAGPGTASNVLLAIRPPAGTASMALQLPQGTNATSNGSYLCSLGSVPFGQNLAVILTAVITNTASYSNFAAVSASVPDPVAANNQCSAMAQGLYFQRGDSIVKITNSARDMVYDRSSGRLFAGSASSNVVQWFDPQNASLEGAMAVGCPPDHLALSDDGHYLYVCSATTSLVQRIDLPTRSVDYSFNVPSNYSVRAAVVLPGQSHALALAGGAFVGILDDGVPRTNILTNPFKLLASSEDGTVLYGYDPGGTGGNSPDVFRMTVDATGLVLAGTGPSDTPWGQNVTMKSIGPRLYFGNGDVLNTNGWSSETAFPRFNYGQYGDMDTNAGRAVFVGIPSSTAQFGIYDLSTRQQLALSSVSDVTGVAGLALCGADRFAFRSGTQIIFIRSSALSGADVSVRSFFSTNQVMAADAFTCHLIVSNAGPAAASGIVLTNYFSPVLNLVSSTQSQGTATSNAGVLVANLGSLNSNGVAFVDLTLAPISSAQGVLTNSADVAFTNPGDPILFNNHFAQTITVLPLDSDHDGIPDQWEIAHGLDPYNAADAALDPDGDGLSNLQEYRSGTDPMVFNRTVIGTPRLDHGGFMSMELNAAVGKVYALEASSNLYNWTAVYSFTPTQTNTTVEIPVDPSPALFYRLRVLTNAP